MELHQLFWRGQAYIEGWHASGCRRLVHRSSYWQRPVPMGYGAFVYVWMLLRVIAEQGALLQCEGQHGPIFLILEHVDGDIVDAVEFGDLCCQVEEPAIFEETHE